MESFISALLGAWSPAYFWQPLLLILPLLLIIFGLAFGINIINDLISSRRSSMISSFMSAGDLHITKNDDYYNALRDDRFYEDL